MFKNLDGFKKVKEDSSVTVMQHPKGHTISIAMKSIPVVHRRQLMSLPLHEACGGVVKMAEGGPPEPHALPPPEEGVQAANERADASQEQAQRNEAGRNAMMALQNPQAAAGDSVKSADSSSGSSGSWDAESPATPPNDMKSSTKSGAGAVRPMSGDNYDYNQIPGFKERVAGSNLGAKAESDIAKSNLATEQENQDTIQDIHDDFMKTSQDLAGHMADTIKDIKDNKINSRAYLQSRDTTQKVGTAIGLLLGGFSTPFTGQGNPALDFLNKQIDRDIDAQKTNQNGRLNIYNAYLNQYKNAAIAANMSKATQLAIYGSQLKQGMLENADPLIRAKALQQLGDWKNQAAALVQQSSFLNKMDKINEEAHGGGRLSNVAPEQLIKFSGAPAAEQKTMYEETKNATNIARNGPKMMTAFDDAAKENTILRTGAGMLRTPGAVLALHQLMLPNFKTIDGTVRQAPMDETFHNITPVPGDSDAKIAIKRKAFADWMESESAAPVTNGYGINLKSFKSTSPALYQQYRPGEIIHVRGQPMKVINDRGDFEPVNNAKRK